jgi:hypothetical protein
MSYASSPSALDDEKVVFTDAHLFYRRTPPRQNAMRTEACAFANP